MSKITGTFDELWKSGLEQDAKNYGVRDGDLPKVRSKIKALFISAGWSSSSGETEFVSERDCANALQAAGKELRSVSERIAAQGKVVQASGTSPTKNQVLSAGVDTAILKPTAVTAGSFNPQMSAAGDRCPKCSGAMTPVGLANGKAGNYCLKDRVVLPLSHDSQLR